MRVKETFAVISVSNTQQSGYTIHANQSTWEADYMVKWHGLRPIEYFSKYDFLGPRLFAAHCR